MNRSTYLSLCLAAAFISGLRCAAIVRGDEPRAKPEIRQVDWTLRLRDSDIAAHGLRGRMAGWPGWGDLGLVGSNSSSGTAEGRVRLVEYQPPPQQPLDPGTGPQALSGPQQPLDTPPTAPASASPFTGLRFSGPSAEPADRPLPEPALDVPASSVVTQAEVRVLATTDPAQLLQESSVVQTVNTQRRNPISFDPHVRGFRFGQIYAQGDGQYWTPVRQDLDSMLSKIDPGLIEDTLVVPGPYGVRYGPGFGFIDVQTARTPRSSGGYEGHLRLGLTYRSNGDQFYGRTGVFGGNTNWGYRINYGNRTGSDYQAGDGTRIPSSYGAQDFWGQFGFDLSPHSSLEIRYQHLDQNDTEYFLQFFDINYLGVNAVAVNYVDENPAAAYTRFRIDSWYNRTGFDGDNLNPSKASVVQRVEAALAQTVPPPDSVSFVGVTYGKQSQFGTRAVATFGADDAAQMNLGGDVRYRGHQIREDYLITEDGVPSEFQTKLPTSWSIDPGLFAELSLPWSLFWTTTLGSRLDFVRTGARDEGLNNFSSADTTQNDTLYAFYLVNDVQLTTHWSTRWGFGHSQRPPTLIERYSDGLFLGIIQSGFSRVVGNPNLAKERLWQLDLSLEADYEDWRIRTSGFYSWVLDFATYEGNIISSPADARLLRAINTDRVRMTGFETYGDALLTRHLSAFGALHYVWAEDDGIDAPLWGIAPLEGRAGLRLHDACQGERWGIELSARIVDNQDRLGVIRNVAAPDRTIAIEQPTAGFTTFLARGYWNASRRLSFVTGFENVFDRDYLEHLDLRLPADPVAGLPAEFVLAPGFNYYLGMEWRN
jgi:outer membrane receptor protein involved in Fe transport